MASNKTVLHQLYHTKMSSVSFLYLCGISKITYVFLFHYFCLHQRRQHDAFGAELDNVQFAV